MVVVKVSALLLESVVIVSSSLSSGFTLLDLSFPKDNKNFHIYIFCLMIDE